MNYKEEFPDKLLEYSAGSPADAHEYKFIFSNLPENKAYYQKSINQTVNAVIDHLEKRKTPFSGASVNEVKSRFRKLPHDFREGLTLQESLDELKELYLNDAVSFHDPKYVAHLNCPILVPALAAEVIISSLNSSMDTWDQSAGATFIELKLVEWTLNHIGYPKQGEGVFTSGGSQSNLMGLLLARDHYIRNYFRIDSKRDGLPAEASRFKIFCSEVSHFSLKKSASILGLGQQSIVPVKVDRDYKMDIISLGKAIEEQKKAGNIPIAVVGTAGTTDFGSIDPLEDIAAVCYHYKLWFHVDAAYGGGLILSNKHKYKLKGIELSDSATIDYHKTFFQPVSSSGFFMRDKNHVDYISYHADYLNPKEREEDGIPDMVKKSIQTTRRFDALKLWMTIRIMGCRCLGQYIEDIVNLAQEAASALRGDGEFEVLNEPEISAIVFRYRPESENPQLTEDQCSALNLYIRKAMFNEGKAILAGTKVNNRVYLKFTLLNPLTSIKHIEDIIEIIKSHGKQYLRNSRLQAISESDCI